jgi:hypothetical protein
VSPDTVAQALDTNQSKPDIDNQGNKLEHVDVQAVIVRVVDRLHGGLLQDLHVKTTLSEVVT